MVYRQKVTVINPFGPVKKTIHWEGIPILRAVATCLITEYKMMCAQLLVRETLTAGQDAKAKALGNLGHPRSGSGISPW
jgi:hypothetical protein